MTRSRWLSVVLSVVAVVVTVGFGPTLTSRLPSSHDAAREARAVFDGVFQGTHSDLQLGPFELAYRVHRVQMGSAEVFDFGVERVRRTDGGEVAGNDWALNLSLAKAQHADGSRYLGNLRVDMGEDRHVHLSLDSAGGGMSEEGVRACSPDAGPALTC